MLGLPGVDAQVAGGVAEGPAVRPLDEQDRPGPAHGRGPLAAEAGEVLVVPLRLKQRGDVFGAVGAAGEPEGGVADCDDVAFGQLLLVDPGAVDVRAVVAARYG